MGASVTAHGGGTAAARYAEMSLQRELMRSGWSLVSGHDAQHKRFGMRNPTPNGLDDKYAPSMPLMQTEGKPLGVNTSRFSERLQASIPPGPEDVLRLREMAVLVESGGLLR